MIASGEVNPAFYEALGLESGELAGAAGGVGLTRTEPHLRNTCSPNHTRVMNSPPRGLTSGPSYDPGPREFIYGTTEARRQHYVPRMYLRSFASSAGGPVPFHNLETGKSGTASVKKLAAEKDRYNFEFEGATISAEEWLGTVEAAAAPWLERLREAEEQLDIPAEGMVALARFMSAQFFRSPAFSSWLESNKRHLVGKIKEQARLILPQDQFEHWDSKPDEVWLQQDPNVDNETRTMLWLLSGTQGYANMLLTLLDWTLLAAPRGRHFYTSDTAFVRWPSPLDDGVLPGSFVSFDYHLPVSPSRALRLRPRRKRSEELQLATLIVKKASKHDVSIANAVQSVSATRFLYGRGPWLPPDDARQILDRQVYAAALTRVIAVAPAPGVSAKAVSGVADARARDLLAEERAKETEHRAMQTELEQILGYPLS